LFCRNAQVFDFTDYAATLLRTAPPVVVSCIVASLLARYVPVGSDLLAQIIRLAASGTAGLMVWLVIIWVTNSAPKVELVRLGVTIIGRRRA